MKNNYFTKKPKRFFIAFLVLFCGLFANTAMGQTTILDETFGSAVVGSYTGGTSTTPSSLTYTVTRVGTGGTGGLGVVSTGDSYLQFTGNSASTASLRTSLIAPFSALPAVSGLSYTLANSTRAITWTVNMRVNRALGASYGDPAYYSSVILCATGNSFPGGTGSGANGYALIMRRATGSATQNAVRLVHFTDGVASTTSGSVISAPLIETPLSASATTPSTTTPDNMSIRVVYTPDRTGGGTWEMFYRADGGTSTSAFISPTTGTALVSAGTSTNATYTNVAMTHFGAVASLANSSTVANAFQMDNYKIVAGAQIPFITGGATATAFATTYGSASAPQTFAVGGTGLSANLVATAPTGFQVSSDGTTYGSTATFTQTSGTASGSLRIRLAATANVTGSYNSQNIVLSSTGANPVNIVTAASGNVVNKATPTLTTAPTATSILSGETLASSLLSGGAASVAGSFAFTTPSTAPTATGNHSVTFTPTDSANYNTFTTTVNVSVITSTTWDGASWSEGNPNPTMDAIINGTYFTDWFPNEPIDAKSLTVTASGSLTIATGTNVTVQNAVVNNGTMTIQNNANLIQVNNVSNSGSVTVNRNGSTLKRLDYTLWSSPVAPNQTLLNFSDLTVTPRFYQYNESSNLYNAVVPSATTFATGKGYLIRMPDQYPANSGNGTTYYAGSTTLAYPGVFTGVLNNGDIPVTLAKSEGINKGYQAVGNPYPSVIDAQEFVTANTANIENTLYFWRKTNGASGSSYATWTSGGGTSVTPSSETPNGKIQVGQGFFVQAKNAVTVSNFFTNAMRDEAPSSTQFFKTKQQAQKDRVWLNLTTTTGVFSQALVAYIDDANLGIDKYDGKYINDSGIALTTSIAGDEYTIQGRPTFDATDVVALNFKTSVAGTYTIVIDHVDGLFSKGQDIYLVDNKLGVTTNLNEGAYSFTAEAGVDNTRFTVTYQKTLKVDAPLFNENSVLVSRNNGTLNVKSSAVAINNVKVYDVQGRLVAERKNVKSNTATISNLRSNQVLIVKVTSENNAVVTKKVLN